MTRTESLVGRLSVQDSEWKAGLARAATQFKSFSANAGKMLSSGVSSGFGVLKSMGGMLAGIGGQVAGFLGALGGIGGVLSAAGITAGIKDITDLGGELSDVSARTGIAVDQLVILREQFRQGGLDIEGVTTYVKKMNAALLDTGKKDVFAGLGLDQAALLAKAPTEAINSIISSVRRLKGVAKQQGALSDIFGKSGVEMMTLVVDPKSAENARKMVGSMANVLADASGDFDTISDNFFGGIPVKIRQAFSGFTDALRKPLLQLAEAVTTMDFTPVGKKLGDQLMWSWDLFSTMWKQDTLFEYVRLGLSNAVMGAFSFAIQGVGILFDELFTKQGTKIWGMVSAIGDYLKGLIQELATTLGSSWLDKQRVGTEAQSPYERRMAESKDIQSSAMESFRNWAETYAITTDAGRILDRLKTIQPGEGTQAAMDRNADRMGAITMQAADSARISQNSPIQSWQDLNPLKKTPMREWTMPGGETVTTQMNRLDPGLQAREQAAERIAQGKSAPGVDSGLIKSALDFLSKIEINTEKTRLGLEVE